MSLRIGLLGRFSLTLDGAAVAEATRARVQDLLAWLILHRAAPSPRRIIASALWPDVRDEQALKNLRTLLTRLHDDSPFLSTWLQVEGDLLQLRLDATCAVDLVLFEEARAAALRALDGGEHKNALNALALAASHYGGDLLPGHEDEWLRPERERLHRAWIDTLDQRARLLSTTGAHLQAQEVARQLLHIDPLHESAYASLMRSQLAQGDRAGALRTYHACAALLRDELGVDPGAETQAAYEAVLFEDGRGAISATARAVTTVERSAPQLLQQWVVAAAPLVGRERSMAWLRDHWTAAQMGAPQVVLLAGEAGIGKTRVVQELAGWVEREGSGEVAIARAYSAGATAYAPIAAWLRSSAGSRRLQNGSALVRTESARLVPELGGSEKVEALDEAWRRHRFYQALAAALMGERDETHAPLLLILEDAQWADAETLLWLPQLLDVAQGKPLLLLLTLRLEESPENEALERLLVELRRSRSLHERELRRLNLEETTQLAAMLAAEASAQSHKSPLATDLFRETEGIPLFIVETVRAGLSDMPVNATEERAGDETLQLSPVVLATLRSRIGQVSRPAREVAECAAVLGREFRYRELAATSLGDEETLVRALDELWRKRIIREQGADAYDFSHDKLRAVAYSGLSSARRRLLHRRAAEAVLEIRGEEQGVSAEVAAHFEEAGEMESALPLLIVAADEARSLFAVSEATDLHRRLLGEKYVRYLPLQERVNQLLLIGDVLNRDYRAVESEPLFLEAEAISLQIADPIMLAKSRLGLAIVMHLKGELAKAMGMASSILETFENRDTKSYLRALEVLGKVLLSLGNVELAITYLRRCVDIAEAARGC